MQTDQTTEATMDQSVFLTKDVLFNHWMGHQGLTRRTIEAFPEDKLFTHSVGGMRPFAELAVEIIRMGGPGVKGAVEGQWPNWEELSETFKTPSNKQDLLSLFDKSNAMIREQFPKLKAEQFGDVIKMFNQWEGPLYWSILYFIDNEIHHRAQGYVYLRSLGIEPPPFWERA